MCRNLVAVVTVASVLFAATLPAQDFGSALTGQHYEASRSPAAFAYLTMSFGSKSGEAVKYGLAFTSPTWGYANSGLDLRAPKLVDLKFSGMTPASLSIVNMTAWSSADGWHVNAADGEDPDRTIWIALGTVAFVAGTVYWICENERGKKGEDKGC